MVQENWHFNIGSTESPPTSKYPQQKFLIHQLQKEIQPNSQILQLDKFYFDKVFPFKFYWRNYSKIPPVVLHHLRPQYKV